jgi:hypothetical protein
MKYIRVQIQTQNQPLNWENVNITFFVRMILWYANDIVNVLYYTKNVWKWNPIYMTIYDDKFLEFSQVPISHK